MKILWYEQLYNLCEQSKERMTEAIMVMVKTELFLCFSAKSCTSLVSTLQQLMSPGASMN